MVHGAVRSGEQRRHACGTGPPRARHCRGALCHLRRRAAVRRTVRAVARQAVAPGRARRRPGVSFVMLRNQNVLCISSIDWSEHWQIHQELMSRLADAGNRVLYIENTGVRRPGIADLSRMRRRLWNWWHSTKGFREVRENLFVYAPLFLPFPYSRVAGWLNRVLLFRALDRWMQATGF